MIYMCHANNTSINTLGNIKVHIEMYNVRYVVVPIPNHGSSLSTLPTEDSSDQMRLNFDWVQSAPLLSPP